MFLSKVTFKPDILKSSQLVNLLQGNTYGYHQLLWDLFDQQQRDFLYRIELGEEQRVAKQPYRNSPVFYVLSMAKPKSDPPLFTVASKPFNPQLTVGQRIAFRLRANPVVTKDGKRHDLVMDEQVAFYKRIISELNGKPAARKSELRQQLAEPTLQRPLNEWLTHYLSETRYFAAIEQNDTRKLLSLAVEEAISQRLQYWLTENPSRKGFAKLATYELEDEQSEQVKNVSLFHWHGYQAHPLPEKNKHAQFRSVDMHGELIVQQPAQLLELIARGIGPAKGLGCGLMLVRSLAY